MPPATQVSDAQLLTDASIQLARQAEQHAEQYILLKHMLSYYDAKGTLTNKQRDWLRQLSTGAPERPAPT